MADFNLRILRAKRRRGYEGIEECRGSGCASRNFKVDNPRLHTRREAQARETGETCAFDRGRVRKAGRTRSETTRDPNGDTQERCRGEHAMNTDGKLQSQQSGNVTVSGAKGEGPVSSDQDSVHEAKTITRFGIPGWRPVSISELESAEEVIEGEKDARSTVIKDGVWTP